MSIEKTKFYKNIFTKYSSEDEENLINQNDNNITEGFDRILTENIRKLQNKLEQKQKYWHHVDYSVYTGSAGIALTLYNYGKCFNSPRSIQKATLLIYDCIQKHRSTRQNSLLTGAAGPLALGAVLYHKESYTEPSKDSVARLMDLSYYVLRKSSENSYELLYGSAGYLSALLYVNKNISPPPIDENLIIKIVNQIITAGKTYAKLNFSESPLMFAWHNKEYVGAAHGLGGILYILLQCKEYLTETQLNDDIKPSIHYLRKLMFPSGNFPSSLGNGSDRLVQWCHGAPGLTALFCLAYKIFGEKEFLTTAIKCGEVTWNRGLLRKGYGLCHGVAGNAYSFIQLFQLTKDKIYLYKACKFAKWCFDYGTNQNSEPDRPYSLFEGIAGVIFFLCEMKHPLSAKFPMYTF